jgi:hypothetical protein
MRNLLPNHQQLKRLFETMGQRAVDSYHSFVRHIYAAETLVSFFLVVMQCEAEVVSWHFFDATGFNLSSHTEIVAALERRMSGRQMCLTSAAIIVPWSTALGAFRYLVDCNVDLPT